MHQQMTQSPLHIRVLRGAAIVLAVSAGSWLIVNSQRNANRQLASDPALSITEPIAGPVATTQAHESLLVTGHPFQAPTNPQQTFIFGSKSFVPSTHIVAKPHDAEAAQTAHEWPDFSASGMDFLYSSKSISKEAFKTLEARPGEAQPPPQQPAPNPTFIHSSKTLNLTVSHRPALAFPPFVIPPEEPDAAKGLDATKAPDSPPKQ